MSLRKMPFRSMRAAVAVRRGFALALLLSSAGGALAQAEGDNAAPGGEADKETADTADVATAQPDMLMGPMADMPGIEVAWPEMSDEVRFSDERVSALLSEQELPSLSPDQVDAFRTAFGQDLGGEDAGPADEAGPTLADSLDYDYDIEGIEDLPVDDIKSRFGQLSVLKEREDDETNIAQINRRAIEDQETLKELLEIDGYYDAFVQYLVDPQSSDKVTVRFSAEPGARYSISDIHMPLLHGLAASEVDMFREALDIEVGDPADQDKIAEGRVRVAAKAGEKGYPFAEVDEPELLVDHAKQAAELTLDGDLGGLHDYGDIVITGDDIFGARHVQRIARFDPGERYDVRDMEDLRQALIATGLVSQVNVEPVKDADAPDEVDVRVDMTKAPPRTIAGELGYDTGQGLRAEASWEHRNFFPPEGALRVRGVAGMREQLAGVTYRRNNWLGRDRVLTVDAVASNSEFDAYDAKTAQLSARFEKKTTMLFQKAWTWFVGAEALYTDERGVLDNLSVDRRTYYIAALPFGLSYDGTDDLLDPHSGIRLGGRLSPELSFNNGTTEYIRAQIDASGYVPAGDALTIAGRLRFGSIFGGGEGIDAIAPSRRNYAGGGGSVRGYGYRSIGPQYNSGDPIGGRGLVEASLEARYRFGNFGIVPFVDAGTVSSEEIPEFETIRVGVGLGGRYYSNFGPIRIDVATPLNRLEGEGWIAVYVSLGQSF